VDFEKDIDLNELSDRINNLRNLEAQESNPEPLNEYLNMDKLTIIKMLMTAQSENDKLHARLDKQDQEAKEREERLNIRIDELTRINNRSSDTQDKLNKRIEELTRINSKSSESQITLMDQLSELHRQLNLMSEQYSQLMTKMNNAAIKNLQYKKEKFGSKKQDVKQDKNDKDDNDTEQRGDRVQQSEDFNGDPTNLKDTGNDIPETHNKKVGKKGTRDYRKGMKYNKSVSTKVYYHNFDMTKLPEGATIIKRKMRKLKSVKLVMSVHEYEWYKVKFADGRMEWVYYPEDPHISDCLDEEYESHREYNPFANTKLTSDSIHTISYLRYGLSTPANRIAEMLKEAGLGGCRQTVINWLNNGGNQLSYLLPTLKEKLLSKGANLNCDETWTRLRINYRDGYKKVYIWCMVNKKEKIVYYFFDKPKEGTRSREVLKQFLDNANVKSLQSDGYVGYVFLDDDVVDIEHIYCLAHVRAKLVVAYDIGKVREAKPFIDLIQELYKLENLYKELKLTPQQIKERRNNKETSEIIQKMRSELERLWPEDKLKQSELDPVFATALRYLYNQWDGLMNYRNDGEYSIDNNISERNIRPATVERKNSLSFGSEDGIECSATYHTIIQTCRMMGVRVLKYLESFYKKFNEGCRDFANMLPGKLAIN